jgi:hypothetical protein
MINTSICSSTHAQGQFEPAGNGIHAMVNAKRTNGLRPGIEQKKAKKKSSPN